TLPYALNIANKGWRPAVREDRSLGLGVNALSGKITHAADAEAFDMEYTPLESVLLPVHAPAAREAAPAHFLTTHAGNASVATTIQLIDTAVAPRARAAAAQFSGRVDAARVRHGRQRRGRPAQRGRDDRAAATRPAPRADRPRHCAARGDGGADPPALRARTEARHQHHQHAVHDQI